MTEVRRIDEHTTAEAIILPKNASCLITVSSRYNV
jgi:hypothetical protein